MNISDVKDRGNMVNVSIITKCNNNCKYCFQEGDYHKRNQMLTYRDIEDILSWSLGDGRIALLGGEPTLHPDFVRIAERCASERPTVIFSNLLGPTNVYEEILSRCPQIGWLVNTTTRDELKDLFEKNIKVFKKYGVKISAGLTLTLNKELDTKFINNLVRIGAEYSEIVHHYRIAQATPYEQGKIDLSSFTEPILEFCKRAEIYTPWVPISLDCPTNCCQIPDDDIFLFEQRYRLNRIDMINRCHPVFDIMADKTVKYCSSQPEDVMPKKYYTDFKNHIECVRYLISIRNAYFQKYHYLCKQYHGECNSTMCAGACFAITEYIRKYMLKQEEEKEAKKQGKKVKKIQNKRSTKPILIDYYNCNYDDVINLGDNCEISLCFSSIFKKSKFEHFLYSYAFSRDRDLFAKSLNNTDKITDSKFTVLQGKMIRQENYKIEFIKRKIVSDTVAKTNLLLKKELKSRLEHYAEKFEKVFVNDKKVLFVIKLSYKNLRSDIAFIKKVNNILAKKFKKNVP